MRSFGLLSGTRYSLSISDAAWNVEPINHPQALFVDGLTQGSDVRWNKEIGSAGESGGSGSGKLQRCQDPEERQRGTVSDSLSLTGDGTGAQNPASGFQNTL